jgi:hypothetical protein
MLTGPGPAGRWVPRLWRPGAARGTLVLMLRRGGKACGKARGGLIAAGYLGEVNVNDGVL